MASLLTPVLVTRTINENLAMTAVPSTVINKKPYMRTLIHLRALRLVSLPLFLSRGIV